MPDFKAPFPWFGGKRRVAPIVWARFGDVRNYVEPFFGSGAVLLGRPDFDAGVPPLETVNDKDGFVSNFWRAVQAAPDEVAHYADWPVNECVPAGTMIATPDGEIPVENIRPGMIVLGDQDGQIVPTRVTATKRSAASDFYSVGPLQLTGNHPVFTAEYGYVQANRLSAGMHVRILRWPVCESDIVVLQSEYEQQAVGDLHAERSAHKSGALCRCDLPEESALPGAFVSRYYRWKDTQGLLDSVSGCGRDKAAIRSDRNRRWQRLAGGRTILDSPLPTANETDQSHRWRRRYAWVDPIAGTAAEMVANACGRPLSTGPCWGNEGQEAQPGCNCQDSIGQQWQENARQYATEIIGIAKTIPHSCRAARAHECGQSVGAADGRISHESIGGESPPKQTNRLCGNRRGIPLNQRHCTCYGREQRRNPVRHQTQYPLQRLHASTSVAVYNFQTTTGNYYANRILVHNCDLHARHIWLVERRAELVERLEGNPDYCDAKIAGWWVWGMACWIGSRFCSGEGPWRRVEVAPGDWRLRKLTSDGQGVQRRLVHLGDGGQGVQRRRVHLGNDGQGVQRKRVHLGNDGRGVQRKLVHLGDGQNAGTGEAGLLAWMEALSERLRRVRICSGDWARVCGRTPTVNHGLTGVFLDPPYSAEAGRDVDLYSTEDISVAHDVREWAIANGDNPLLRIALCGYDTEHAMPDNWQVYRWFAHGGYSNTGTGAGKTNKAREVIWFSPHCLTPDSEQAAQQMALGGEHE